MDGTKTEFAQQWGTWLTDKLKTKRTPQGKPWTGADLRRAIEAAGGSVGPSQMSRWLAGDQRPSVASAGLVADVLGVDRREAYTIAGRFEALSDSDGPIVVSDDPAEPFIQRIRARRLPAAIEARLIDEVRREIEHRLAALDGQLDTVETAVDVRPER